MKVLVINNSFVIEKSHSNSKLKHWILIVSHGSHLPSPNPSGISATAGVSSFSNGSCYHHMSWSRPYHCRLWDQACSSCLSCEGLVRDVRMCKMCKVKGGLNIPAVLLASPEPGV